jgi:hypothetical protein
MEARNPEELRLGCTVPQERSQEPTGTTMVKTLSLLCTESPLPPPKPVWIKTVFAPRLDLRKGWNLERAHEGKSEGNLKCV